MKTASCVLFAVLCTLVCSCQSSLSLRETDSAGWVSFHKEAAVVRNGHKMVQTLAPSTHVRSVYVQRESDERPVLFYTHERRIEAVLGHQGRLALINDYFATKACKVIVADIDAGSNWRIDKEVRRQHSHNAPEQWQPNQAIPKAIAFSPDDRMVLVAMQSGYVAASPEKAGEFGRRFKMWSYVVDSASGSVLHVYQTNGTVPRNWWKLRAGA